MAENLPYFTAVINILDCNEFLTGVGYATKTTLNLPTPEDGSFNGGLLVSWNISTFNQTAQILFDADGYYFRFRFNEAGGFSNWKFIAST